MPLRDYQAPEAYAELAAYTLSLGDPAFIHQHVVDTYGAQAHGATDKPIRLVQSLVGLYLHVDHRFTGRQVQRVHTLLADRRPVWPVLDLPLDRGMLTVLDVIQGVPGVERNAAIEDWTASTWVALSLHRTAVADFLAAHGISTPR
jgi:Family of unknown function (DUF5946)